MNTTQPAISSRIAKLESIVGARLIDRDKSRIGLTTEGEYFLPHAEKLLRLSETLPELITRADSLQGTIRIGVTELAIATWFRHFYRNLQTIFPGANLEISVDSSDNLGKMLLRQELDITFVLGPVRNTDFKCIKFGTFENGWAACPTVGLQPAKLHNFSNIVESFPIITGGKKSQLHREIADKISSIGSVPHRLQCCTNFNSMLQLTQFNAGVVAMPKRLLSPYFASGELIPIMCEWTPSALHYTACTLGENQRTELTRIIHYAKSLL